MTQESLRKLENTPVGKTVEVEGRVITVVDRTICCADNKCTFGGWRNCRGPRCTATSRFDNKFVAYIDLTPPAIAPHNELLNSKSAAHRLGVTVKKVREMAQKKLIPAHKTGASLGYERGRNWIFDSRDVDAYMEKSGRGTSLNVNSITVGGTICKPADSTDLATRLLPFDGVDEHMVYPIVKYRIVDIDNGLFSAVGYVAMGDGVMFSGDYGKRVQAIEACRNDLRLRLAAVDELRRVA